MIDLSILSVSLLTQDVKNHPNTFVEGRVYLFREKLHLPMFFGVIGPEGSDIQTIGESRVEPIHWVAPARLIPELDMKGDLVIQSWIFINPRIYKKQHLPSTWIFASNHEASSTSSDQFQWSWIDYFEFVHDNEIRRFHPDSSE